MATTRKLFANVPRSIAGHVQSLRLVREDAVPSLSERKQMRSPRDAFALLRAVLASEENETFGIIALDSQHRAIAGGFVVITRGVVNSSLVDPRVVFRSAIALNAAAIILAHNHPSGDPTPSADDRLVTEHLVAAGRLLDIPVQDHIIVTPDRFVSFAEAGLL